MSKFKKGMTVIKTISGLGFSEKNKQKVHSIEDGVVYLADDEGFRETGITYSESGDELERFFLPMISRIEPAPIKKTSNKKKVSKKKSK